MRKFLITPAAVAASVVALVMPALANADPGLTVMLGPSATLEARVLVHVPVTVTCDLGGDFFPMSFVSIQQASGTQIASGTGFLSTVTCDGAPHTYAVSVTANAPGPPFHGGQAVAFASVNIFGPFGGEGGSAGPQTILIRP